MASIAVTNLIEGFHNVIAYTTAHDGEEMVVLKHPVAGKVDYTIPVMVSAKRIMDHKRMMNKIRKTLILGPITVDS